MSDELDILYSTIAPDGTISARQGRIALYKNGANYEVWQNTTGLTVWVRVGGTTNRLWEVDGAETQLSTADEIDMQSKKIINVTDPASAQDAATKAYADGKISKTTASEISAMTEKTSIVGDDLFLIEDSESSNAKKKIKKSTLVNTGIQIFTANGTFTAPAGVTKVYISMCGGGGGGGHGGGGGGGGVSMINYPYTVTPGNNYTVTIGGGGAGAAISGGTGTAGGTTSFDTLSVPGGNGGVGSSGAGGTSPGGFNGSGATGGIPAFSSGSGASGSGGGGGSTPFGVGATGNTNPGGNAANNSGGGGGGGSSGNNGGNGGSGVCIVMY